MGRIRVFLADDHKAMRERIVELLGTECDIVGTATDGRETIDGVTKLKPDVLVLDVTMHDLSGIEVSRRLKADGVGSSIVFLTVHEDPEFAKEAIEIGALGYVIKPRMASDLKVAVKEAYAGRSFSRRATSIPLISCMVMSSTRTSGFSFVAPSTAPRPSAAVPTMSHSVANSITARSRIASWSSAKNTRIRPNAEFPIRSDVA